MKMKKYEITTEEYEAVVKARKAAQNKGIARRLRVIELRYEGKTSKEIAEKLDMNWMYISEIVKRFKRQGLEEFARNKYTGHNRKLSYQQEEDILQECERKAEEGHITTVEEVRKALNAEIGGNYRSKLCLSCFKATWLGEENVCCTNSWRRSSRT